MTARTAPLAFNLRFCHRSNVLFHVFRIEAITSVIASYTQSRQSCSTILFVLHEHWFRGRDVCGRCPDMIVPVLAARRYLGRLCLQRSWCDWAAQPEFALLGRRCLRRAWWQNHRWVRIHLVSPLISFVRKGMPPRDPGRCEVTRTC